MSWTESQKDHQTINYFLSFMQHANNVSYSQLIPTLLCTFFRSQMQTHLLLVAFLFSDWIPIQAVLLSGNPLQCLCMWIVATNIYDSEADTLYL